MSKKSLNRVHTRQTCSRACSQACSRACSQACTWACSRACSRAYWNIVEKTWAVPFSHHKAAVYPWESWSKFLVAGCPSSHQPTRIREETLESGGPLQRKLNLRLRTFVVRIVPLCLVNWWGPCVLQKLHAIGFASIWRLVVQGRRSYM